MPEPGYQPRPTGRDRLAGLARASWEHASRAYLDAASRPATHDLRASDADRERVVALLTEAAVDGRLTADEHAERIEAAFTARTLAELAPLTADLGPASEQPIRLDSRRLITGLGRREYREGRWVVPERLTVSAVFGEVTLDLREAVLASRRILMFATVAGGTLRLIVPEHVAVEVTGAAVLGRTGAGRTGGGRTERSGPEILPGTPVIDVRAYVMGGRVRVIRPRPRRRRPGRRI